MCGDVRETNSAPLTFYYFTKSWTKLMTSLIIITLLHTTRATASIFSNGASTSSPTSPPFSSSELLLLRSGGTAQPFTCTGGVTGPTLPLMGGSTWSFQGASTVVLCSSSYERVDLNDALVQGNFQYSELFQVESWAAPRFTTFPVIADASGSQFKSEHDSTRVFWGTPQFNFTFKTSIAVGTTNELVVTCKTWVCSLRLNGITRVSATLPSSATVPLFLASTTTFRLGQGNSTSYANGLLYYVRITVLPSNDLVFASTTICSSTPTSSSQLALQSTCAKSIGHLQCREFAIYASNPPICDTDTALLDTNVVSSNTETTCINPSTFNTTTCIIEDGFTLAQVLLYGTSLCTDQANMLMGYLSVGACTQFDVTPMPKYVKLFADAQQAVHVVTYTDSLCTSIDQVLKAPPDGIFNCSQFSSYSTSAGAFLGLKLVPVSSETCVSSTRDIPLFVPMNLTMGAPSRVRLMAYSSDLGNNLQLLVRVVQTPITSSWSVTVNTTLAEASPYVVSWINDEQELVVHVSSYFSGILPPANDTGRDESKSDAISPHKKITPLLLSLAVVGGTTSSLLLGAGTYNSRSSFMLTTLYGIFLCGAMCHVASSLSSCSESLHTCCTTKSITIDVYVPTAGVTTAMPTQVLLNATRSPTNDTLIDLAPCLNTVCPVAVRGNGICDRACNIACFAFDGQDCANTAPTLSFAPTMIQQSSLSPSIAPVTLYPTISKISATKTNQHAKVVVGAGFSVALSITGEVKIWGTLKPGFPYYSADNPSFGDQLDEMGDALPMALTSIIEVATSDTFVVWVNKYGDLGMFPCGVPSNPMMWCPAPTSSPASEQYTSDLNSFFLPTSQPGELVPEAKIRVAMSDATTGVICMTNSRGALLCWGDNRYSMLLRSDSVTAVLPGNGTDVLRVMDLGTGLKVSEFSISPYHGCAIFADDGRVKCWGRNVQGETYDAEETFSKTTGTLPPSVISIGFTGGDALPFVNLLDFTAISTLYTPAISVACSASATHATSCFVLVTGALVCQGGTSLLGGGITGLPTPNTLLKLTVNLANSASQVYPDGGIVYLYSHTSKPFSCVVQNTFGASASDDSSTTMSCFGASLAFLGFECSSFKCVTSKPVEYDHYLSPLLVTSSSTHMCYLVRNGYVKCIGVQGPWIGASTPYNDTRAPDGSLPLDPSFIGDDASERDDNLAFVSTESAECPPGTWSSTGISDSGCLLCARGTFSSVSRSRTCSYCPAHASWTSANGATSQADCGAAPGFVLVNGTSVQCPKGADCSQGGFTVETMPVYSGYWRPNPLSLDVRPCLHALYCKGGKFTASTIAMSSNNNRRVLTRDTFGSDLCLGLLHGIMCEECPTGTARRGLDGDTCSACDNETVAADQSRVAAVLSGLSVAGLVLVGVTYFILFTRLRIDNEKGRRQQRGFFRALDLGLKIRVVVGLFQVLGAMAVQIVVLPDFFQNIRLVFSVLGADLLLLVDLGCAVPTRTFWTDLLFTTILPLGFLVALTMIHIIVLTVVWCIKLEQDVRIKYWSWLNAVALTTVLIIMFLCYPSVSQTILLSFKLDTFEDGIMTLSMDHTIFTTDSSFPGFTAYAAVMTVLYVFGIPVTYFALLVRDRRHINPPVPGGSPIARLYRAKDITALRTQFLWKPYLPRWFWWETLEMVRKLLSTSIIVFVSSSGVEAQLIYQILVSLVFMGLAQSARPFIRSNDLALSVASLWVIVGVSFVSLLSLFYQCDSTVDPQVVGRNVDVLNGIITALVAIVPILALADMMLELREEGYLVRIGLQPNRLNLFDKDGKLKIAVVEQIAQQESGNVGDAFRLPEEATEDWDLHKFKHEYDGVRDRLITLGIEVQELQVLRDVVAKSVVMD